MMSEHNCNCCICGVLGYLGSCCYTYWSYLQGNDVKVCTSWSTQPVLSKRLATRDIPCLLLVPPHASFCPGEPLFALEASSVFLQTLLESPIRLSADL